MPYKEFIRHNDLQNCHAKVMRCRTVGTNKLGYRLYVKTIEFLEEHGKTRSPLKDTIPGNYRAVYIEKELLFAWYSAVLGSELIGERKDETQPTI